ncbi:hypothetical protein ACFLU6_16050 [Acidobacteriota bacterium]
MKRALLVIGLLIGFTTLAISGTKAGKENLPGTPFSLYVFAEPEKTLNQNPKAKLEGRDKAIVSTAKKIRKCARKQYANWFALADSPARAEIVLEIKERMHEKRKKDINIEGAVKILDLYDGPITSDYAYCDTGSLKGSEKWTRSADQLVMYLSRVCGHNLALLEERREFFRAVSTGECEDARDAWKRILDVEVKVLTAHNRLINLARKKTISNKDAAGDLDREVLQPWQENIERLSRISVHESQKGLYASIESYMKLREEGWILLISAFRDGDDEKLIEANQKQNDAQKVNAAIQDMLRGATGLAM